MGMKVFVLLAAVCHISQSAPQWLSYAAVHPVASVVTGNSVPVAVGGYKAVAGSNGDLAGPVHEVPGLVPAPALNKQENANGGALTVGTGAFVKYSLSKRSAEADAAVLASSVSYVNPVSTVYHAAPYAYPYTYAGVHAPLLWG